MAKITRMGRPSEPMLENLRRLVGCAQTRKAGVQ